jgi:hypothetical protein
VAAATDNSPVRAGNGAPIPTTRPGFAPGTGVGTTFSGEDTPICMLYRYKDTSSGLITVQTLACYTFDHCHQLAVQMKASFKMYELKAHISRCLLTDAASTMRYSASDVIWYRLGSQHVSNLGEGGLLSLKLTETASSLKNK